MVGEGRPEGILKWASFVGQGPPRYTLTYSPKMASPEYAMLLIPTSSFEVINELIPRIERYCTDHFPDVIPDVRKMLNGPRCRTRSRSAFQAKMSRPCSP